MFKTTKVRPTAWRTRIDSPRKGTVSRSMLLGSLIVMEVIGATLVAPGLASAAPIGAPKLSGYTLVEADGTVPADGQGHITASCPSGDDVLGGGGYQSTQNTQESLNSSYPISDTAWSVYFNNASSGSVTGVTIAYCASSSSLKKFSVSTGSSETVPANSDLQVTATCPAKTVSLGGGWFNDSTEVTAGATMSAPLGTNGWRAFVAAGSESVPGRALAVCAKEPAGWAQVSSAYSSVPAGSQATVGVACPSGSKVVGGGSFDSSDDSLVLIGLTDSFSSKKGWQSAVNNNTGSAVSADAWGVCVDK